MPNDALGMRALTNLSAQLKTVDKTFRAAVRKNLRAGVSQAGAGVVGRVQAGYAVWSSTIPGAVKLSTRYNTNGASIRIIVDHTKARQARPYELGNKATFNEPDIQQRLTSGKARNRRQAIKQSRHALGAAAVTGHALRVPVYHKVGEPGGWSLRATRPTFFPAVTASSKDIDLAMEKVVIQTAHDAGFK